jgi:ADP-heptose:LPS heptosyltransferase
MQSFKRWKKERFKELAEKLLHMNIRVLIIGTEEEREEIDYINQSIKNGMLKVLKEQLTLPQITLLLKNVDLIIGNDTALIHLGAISGIPSIVIYGPTDPVKNKPWNVRSKIVRKDYDCSPCYNFRLPQCRRRYKCLSEISVEQVYDAAKELLGEFLDHFIIE